MKNPSEFCETSHQLLVIW